MRSGRILVAAALLAAGLAEGQASAQDLGHRMPGSLGINAGALPMPGLQLLARALHYDANQLQDRNGNRVPLESFDLDVGGAALGVAAGVELRRIRTYVGMAMAVPVARLRLDVADLRANVDQFGLTDVFVQPLKLGWRTPWVDLVTAYALYVPTGRFRLEGNRSLSSGQYTHEFSAGGTVYFDRRRTSFLSALASYDLNDHKLGLDLTRGDLVQIQGGAGGRLRGFVEVGLTGYALWQVRADRGSELPPILAGARDRTYGIGPELAVLVRQIGARASLRYARDLAARARPEGQLVMLSLTFVAWRPTHSAGHFH